ncbi:MAG: hypothetical protein RL095_2603 [Verrucomicrobiota bacterium]|jgi:type II secretory pathway pseudopilin PulG
MRKSTFNLVEILVAMAILTIGMVGLVGIIPISTEALNNANGKLYAAEIAQSMADYVDADVNGLTVAGATPAYGHAFDTAAIFSATGSGSLYPSESTNSAFPDVFEGWGSSIGTDASKCPDANVLFSSHPWLGTVYKCSNNKGLYRVARKSDSVGGVQDFSALACVWFIDGDQWESTRFRLNGGTELILPRPNALCAMIEINWPGNLSPEINRAAGRSLTIQRYIRVR